MIKSENPAEFRISPDGYRLGYPFDFGYFFYLYPSIHAAILKRIAFILACYVLLLSLLPAAGATGWVSVKKSCSHCCPKKSSSPKKAAETAQAVNPFYGCSQCAASFVPAAFVFLLFPQAVARTLPILQSAIAYTAPHFDFWHPPKTALVIS